MTDTPASADDALSPLPVLTSILDAFSTDRVAEEDGKWFINYFGDKAPGCDVKLRGFNSKASVTVRRRLESQYRHLMQADGTFAVDVMQKLLALQVAEAIVIDWRGALFVERDGTTKLGCTPETVLRLMNESPYLRNRFISTANEVDQFRAADQKAAVKN